MEKQNKLFVPQFLKIGYNERKDTFTKRLAFITYLNQDSTIKDEKSWRKWIEVGIGTPRNPTEGSEMYRKVLMKESYTPMDLHDYPNAPTSGFVLNKTVGGYRTQFSFRDVYTRIFDPRGFEFEIGRENLIFIIKNNGISKGGELNGDYLYAWDNAVGKVILLPVESVEYKESETFTTVIQSTKIDRKSLVVGNMYESNSLEKLIYLGTFDKFDNREISCESVEKQSDIKTFKYVKNRFMVFLTNSNVNKYSFLSDTKNIKINKGVAEEIDVNSEIELLKTMEWYGDYIGFEFSEITDSTISDIMKNECTSVFKISDDVIVEYWISPTYKKWGDIWNNINIHEKDRYWLLDKSYKQQHVNYYKKESVRVEGFKTLAVEELKNGYRIGKIALTNNTDINLSYIKNR